MSKMDREDGDKDRRNGGETGLVGFSPPSSLHADSLFSYPTHLEISTSETAVLEVSPTPSPPGPAHTKSDDPTSPGTPAETCQKHYFEAPTKNATSHPTTVKNSKLDVHTEPVLASAATKTSSQLATLPEPTPEPSIVEADFFSFVILHAPEDMEMACRLKERLEAIDVGVGATFTEDFAIPGRNTLMCVEDAINNSAYTLLLLTCNFNTRMLEVEASSAIINSIQNPHKCHTVIPLLPQENCIPPERMPLVLSRLIPLKENNRFDRMAKKAIAKTSVEKQRREWVKEQRVREQVKRQEEQRLMNRLDMLELERGPWYHPHQSIHIENAQNIIIGNNCQMTVGVSGDSLGV